MGGRVEVMRDQNGYFRHVDGRPLVVIFDSRHEESILPNVIAWQEPILGLQTPEIHPIIKSYRGGTKKTLKFRNSLQPARRTGQFTNTRLKQQCKTEVPSLEMPYIKPIGILGGATCNNKFGAKQLPFNWQGFSIPMALPLHANAEFPISMEPYMYILIDRYARVIASLPQAKFCIKSPASQGWLPLAITDAALLHTILCCSALYSDLLAGKSHSREVYIHMKDAVHLLSNRLQCPENELSDATLVSVAHLADFECISGNFENWKMHIEGLSKMVEIRGGIKTLNEDLMNKVLVADITGCVATLSRPHFTLPNYLISRNHNLPLPEVFQSLFKVSYLDTNFIAILQDLESLTCLLTQTTLDIPIITTAIIALQHQLLTHFTSSFTHAQPLQEIFCVASLLFLLIISTSKRIFGPVGVFPHGVFTNHALVHRLKRLLASKDAEVEENKSFVLWVLFLGGIMVRYERDRMWFVRQMVEVAAELGIEGWEAMEKELKRWFWVERVCGIEWQALWDDVVGMPEVER